jgi:hypothetical protein
MNTQQIVTVEEVASRANVPLALVNGWADKLSVTIQHDWSGRPAITEEDATRLLGAIREAGRQAAELQRAYELYESDWKRRQHEEAEAEFQRFIVQALEEQRAAVPSSEYAYYGGAAQLAVPFGGAVYTAANEVASAVRAEFAQREPLQSLDQFERRWKKGRRR